MDIPFKSIWANFQLLKTFFTSVIQNVIVRIYINFVFNSFVSQMCKESILCRYIFTLKGPKIFILRKRVSKFFHVIYLKCLYCFGTPSPILAAPEAFQRTIYLKSDSNLLKNCFICFSVSPLKIMKNGFYFMVKALFVL